MLIFLLHTQRRVEDWKAEYMFQLLFHPKNELSPADWPAEIQQLILTLQIGPQSTRDTILQATQDRVGIPDAV